ncbi:MBL fold metallo-hydrolase [Edaphobacter acidisoli]|uniref:MBL fold metallo-hydrolase n=2 Tax=Edaphobacter acidisoli TaxID=2040573 RepID=A0A916VZJ9_9BACT|nr:MBL fold metallo-hydrolase [Edaphobacter acidisoli]
MLLEPARRKGRQYLNPVPTNVGGPSVIFKVGPRFLFGTNGRQPSKPLGPFHTDAAIYATQPRSGLRITWMGHSTSLIEIDGARILIDPVWDERAAPTNWAGPKRFFAPPLALSDLPPLDAVIVSHDHYDHLGERTIRALSQHPATENAQWITSLGVGALLQQFGVPAARCLELNWMDRTQIGAVEITALPSRHFSGRSLFNRFETLWSSFALIGPNHRIYYGADSGEWPGFHEIGQRFGPFDLTMLEIGASDPLWADIHMGPEGAARSFRALGGHGLLMPIHWGLFNLALHPWTQPIETISSAADLKLWSPTPGTPSDVIANEELRSAWWRPITS